MNQPIVNVQAGSPLKQAGSSRRGFTLVELLIVISIIAILAGLLIPVSGGVNRARTRARVRAELNMVQMAIENYKTKLGHYPPDNPGVPARNQLYFELLGTTNMNRAFGTLDGSGFIRANEFTAAFPNQSGQSPSGFVNCSGTGGGDEARVARKFLQDLKPGNSGNVSTLGNDQIKFLLCSVNWPDPNPANCPLGVPQLNPFRYNSSNPTNNPNSFDLWVDVVISGKTNRISNWSKEPIIVAVP